MESDSTDVTGPVFLSYRQSDGTPIVEELAWLLRAAGIPVWRDKDDLPPGDTMDRLEQAIAGGLSGAVLVVSPEVTKSPVVKQIEAPELIKLHQAQPGFALFVANAIRGQDRQSIDYLAPDRLLERPREDLRRVDQSSTSREGLLSLAHGALWHRMAVHRPIVEKQGEFRLTVQTRNVGQVYDRTGAQLDIRVRRSDHEKLPSQQGLEDLKQTLAWLPDAITRTGAERVSLSGGAHLSVAFALGAALPSTRVHQLSVLSAGASWASTTESCVPAEPALHLDVSENEPLEGTGTRPRVVVYVDLMPVASDGAYHQYLEEHRTEYQAHALIRPIQRGLLDATQAGDLAAEATAHIRAVSAQYGNAQVDLLLRGPFPMAVLMGRLCNTLRVRVCEWDDSGGADGEDQRPRYVPTLDVRPGATSGAISAVLLPAPGQRRRAFIERFTRLKRQKHSAKRRRWFA